jgi:hypothetical protein
MVLLASTSGCLRGGPEPLASAVHEVYPEAQAAPSPALLPARPPPEDRSADSLRAYTKALVAAYGGRDRGMPLAVKAEHYAWQIERYHGSSYGQVQPRVVLPSEPDGSVEIQYGADTSTWNGSFLAALSYEYAVTRSPEVLSRIVRLLEGLHFFQVVTGQPGLAARCVLPGDEPVRRARLRYDAPDGTPYVYRSDPAKGTYNQLLLGYATLRMLAYDALPASAQDLARNDLHALVLHLLDHDYRLTGSDGTRTPYGNLTPSFAGLGLPFNAQVAYLALATGHAFPARDEAVGRRIAAEHERLRRGRVYYEIPWIHPLIRPQHVGRSVFIKFNDQNHVANAAYVGLALELHEATRSGRAPDTSFLYELGRTLYWTTRAMDGERNSLVNFMWAGLLEDPTVAEALLRDGQERDRVRVDRLVGNGLEQLRRFPLDRFRPKGRYEETEELHWVNQYKPDAYYWKVDPHSRWVVEGPTTDLLTSAIDYLHAYWLMRHFRLEDHPAAHHHASVLAP